MNLYNVTVNSDNYPHYVIARDEAEASKLVIRKQREWKSTDYIDYASNVKLLAEEGKYGRPYPLLISNKH